MTTRARRGDGSAQAPVGAAAGSSAPDRGPSPEVRASRAGPDPSPDPDAAAGADPSGVLDNTPPSGRPICSKMRKPAASRRARSKGRRKHSRLELPGRDRDGCQRRFSGRAGVIARPINALRATDRALLLIAAATASTTRLGQLGREKHDIVPNVRRLLL